MRAGLRRASCSARALSTSNVSVPATAMADKDVKADDISRWFARRMLIDAEVRYGRAGLKDLQHLLG
jgi:hypothetical protein